MAKPTKSPIHPLQTLTMNTPAPHLPAAIAAEDALLAELDQILDAMRGNIDETPQWEFCEGFMAALLCCRRSIPAAEFLPVLFEMEPLEDGAKSAFADQAQMDRFMLLWQQRWQQIRQALDTEVDTLADARAYVPALMDVRAAIDTLTPDQRAQMQAEVGDVAIPSYGQMWAVGFMYAVESWPDEWVAPRNDKIAKVLDGALQSIVKLAEDETDAPSFCLGGDSDGAPSVSQQRLDDLADALWGVYDLRALWQHIGPREKFIRRTVTPGRNDPCSCGSGKKYKKCCGAG